MRNRLMMLVCLGILSSLPAYAQQEEYIVTIKDHAFIPQSIELPANKKIKLVIDNQDPTPEEFESHDLNREKVIPGNSKGVIFLGPLKTGTYQYVGEFHEDNAKGTIVVK